MEEIDRESANYKKGFKEGFQEGQRFGAEKSVGALREWVAGMRKLGVKEWGGIVLGPDPEEKK